MLAQTPKIVDLRPAQKPCIKNQAYTCVFVVMPRSMEVRRPTHSHGGAVPSTCLQTVAVDHPTAENILPSLVWRSRCLSHRSIPVPSYPVQ